MSRDTCEPRGKRSSTLGDPLRTRYTGAGVAEAGAAPEGAGGSSSGACFAHAASASASMPTAANRPELFRLKDMHFPFANGVDALFERGGGGIFGMRRMQRFPKVVAARLQSDDSSVPFLDKRRELRPKRLV